MGGGSRSSVTCVHGRGQLSYTGSPWRQWRQEVRLTGREARMRLEAEERATGHGQQRKGPAPGALGGTVRTYRMRKRTGGRPCAGTLGPRPWPVLSELSSVHAWPEWPPTGVAGDPTPRMMVWGDDSQSWCFLSSVGDLGDLILMMMAQLHGVGRKPHLLNHVHGWAEMGPWLCHRPHRVTRGGMGGPGSAPAQQCC